MTIDLINHYSLFIIPYSLFLNSCTIFYPAFIRLFPLFTNYTLTCTLINRYFR